ncbi:MAG: hypothetical protein RIQ95_1530, partial [Pseudomonadota bacterium]
CSNLSGADRLIERLIGSRDESMHL